MDGAGRLCLVPVSPQGQPADVRKARNRPGLLAHGGGWAHFSWLTWLARRRRPRARLEHMSSVDETPGSPLSINHLMLTLQRGHDPSCVSIISYEKTIMVELEPNGLVTADEFKHRA